MPTILAYKAGGGMVDGSPESVESVISRLKQPGIVPFLVVSAIKKNTRELESILEAAKVAGAEDKQEECRDWLRKLCFDHHLAVMAYAQDLAMAKPGLVQRCIHESCGRCSILYKEGLRILGSIFKKVGKTDMRFTSGKDEARFFALGEKLAARAFYKPVLTLAGFQVIYVPAEDFMRPSMHEKGYLNVNLDYYLSTSKLNPILDELCSQGDIGDGAILLTEGFIGGKQHYRGGVKTITFGLNSSDLTAVLIAESVYTLIKMNKIDPDPSVPNNAHAVLFKKVEGKLPTEGTLDILAKISANTQFVGLKAISFAEACKVVIEVRNIQTGTSHYFWPNPPRFV